MQTYLQYTILGLLSLIASVVITNFADDVQYTVLDGDIFQWNQ